MVVRQPRYSKEEFARRGNEIYASQVRHQVEADNHGKIAAICSLRFPAPLCHHHKEVGV